MKRVRALWSVSLLRRYQHKLSAPASIAVDAQGSRPSARIESAQVDLQHSEQVFARKSGGELLRGWVVFKMFTFDSLVDNGLKVDNWQPQI